MVTYVARVIHEKTKGGYNGNLENGLDPLLCRVSFCFLTFRQYYSAHFFILEDVAILNFTIMDSVLTCISTGRPATTVTWTRDSEIIPDNGDSTHATILGNRDLEQYIHTLNVTETVSGVYGCSVSNSKPSSAKALLNVTGRHLY